jgi:hypothetical protein
MTKKAIPAIEMAFSIGKKRGEVLEENYFFSSD